MEFGDKIYKLNHDGTPIEYVVLRTARGNDGVIVHVVTQTGAINSFYIDQIGTSKVELLRKELEKRKAYRNTEVARLTERLDKDVERAAGLLADAEEEENS